MTEPAVVMVHGFTASPAQLFPQKHALEALGRVVIAPMLRGHGTAVHEMLPCHWEDWYADALEAIKTASQAVGGGPVDYMGLSFGALLGVHIAIEHPELIRRLALLATPFELPLFGRVMWPIMRYTPLRLLRYWPKSYDDAVFDPAGRKIYMETSYDKMPVRGIGEVRKLQAIVAQQCHNLKSPTLMIHSPGDTSAPFAPVQKFAKSCAAVQELIALENSGHVMTLDTEQNIINKHLERFFACKK